ncbi:MAG TPA: D-aminoacyl-tRNA deacylase [Gemmatimonadales bacterium]
MRIVLQRVARASVTIAGEVRGRIGTGFCLLVGFTHSDTRDDVAWMAEKVAGLRLFPDADGRMNRSLADAGGDVLVISQFTLYGDTSRGRRPSFVAAAPPEIAVPLYEAFIGALRGRGLTVATGEFGAHMDVDLLNDGPVTLVLERGAP